MPLNLGSYTDGTPVPNWYTAKADVDAAKAAGNQMAYDQAISIFNYVNQMLGYRIDLIGDIRAYRKAAAPAVTGLFDAILFDNDGVLVDTEHFYFRANQEALAGVGIDLDAAAYVELFLREGRGAWHLARERGLGPADIDALRAARDRRYFDMVAAADVLIPGVADIVPALARRYRLAIVTSSEPGPFARTHARTGLLEHFELVLAQGDYARAKPEPDPYLRAVERWASPPTAAW